MTATVALKLPGVSLPQDTPTTTQQGRASMKPDTKHTKHFEIRPNGDPFGGGWEIHESIYRADGSIDDRYAIYRGDISPSGMGRDRTISKLRRMYPGCRVRVTP